MINKAIIDGHAFCFGLYTVGVGQKFLKFDFFRTIVLEEFNVISGIVVDLTEFQQVSSHYYDVLNASKAYTWRLDLQSNEATFAPSYLEHAIHGPGSLSIALNDWISILHPDDVQGAKKALKQLTSLEKKKVIVEYRRKDKYDKWIWLRVHASVSKYDFSGMPLEIKGISFNITSEREGDLIK
jgi:PAS domain-containing protein